jgi:hypothetical protein
VASAGNARRLNVDAVVAYMMIVSPAVDMLLDAGGIVAEPARQADRQCGSRRPACGPERLKGSALSAGRVMMVTRHQKMHSKRLVLGICKLSYTSTCVSVSWAGLRFLHWKRVCPKLLSDVW